MDEDQKAAKKDRHFQAFQADFLQGHRAVSPRKGSALATRSLCVGVCVRLACLPSRSRRHLYLLDCAGFKQSLVGSRSIRGCCIDAADRSPTATAERRPRTRRGCGGRRGAVAERPSHAQLETSGHGQAGRGLWCLARSPSPSDSLQPSIRPLTTRRQQLQP